MSAFTNLEVKGGSTNVSATGKLTAPSLVLQLTGTNLDMQGTVDLTGGYKNGGSLFLNPAVASPASAGTWIGNADSNLVTNVTGGSTYEISGPVSGRFTVQALGGNGPSRLHITGPASCQLADLSVHPPGLLDLDRSCSASGTFQIFNSSYRFGGRSGAGTLTAAKGDIQGGGLFGTGLTRITGATTINGNSGGPAIYGGATLRTEGATSLAGGLRHPRRAGGGAGLLGEHRRAHRRQLAGQPAVP